MIRPDAGSMSAMDTSTPPPDDRTRTDRPTPPDEPSPRATAGLPDDPTLEQALADARRAALESADVPDVDPLGLYALEVERDEALDDLAAHLPPDASVRLARHAIVQRVGGPAAALAGSGGSWERVEGWVTSVTTADSRFTLSRQAGRPLAAAELLLNAWRAHGPAGDDDAGLPIQPSATPAAPADGPRAA
jgi:hypothetical protein